MGSKSLVDIIAIKLRVCLTKIYIYMYIRKVIYLEVKGSLV